MQERRPDPTIDNDFFQQAWIKVAVIVAGVILIDQLTKTWAERNLSDGKIIDVVGPLQLALLRNDGVAFGIGAGIAPILVAVAIVGLVLVLLGKQIHLQTGSIIGMALLLGGALGNLGDRLFRSHGGAVVDFIDLGWWPTFNVADACIVVGAVMLVLWGSRKPVDQ